MPRSSPAFGPKVLRTFGPGEKRVDFVLPGARGQQTVSLELQPPVIDAARSALRPVARRPPRVAPG